MNCTQHPDREAIARGLCTQCYARTQRGKPLTDPERAQPGTTTQLSIRVSLLQRQAWQRAANRAKQPLRDWIRRVLDSAAVSKREKTAQDREGTRQAIEKAWEAFTDDD